MKKKNRYAKQVGGLAVGALGAAIGAQALGAVGGTSALHGQAALQNVSKFAPAAGHIIGAGMVMGVAQEAFKQPIKMTSDHFPKKKIKKILIL